MKMLKEITIKGYRGLRKITFAPKSINIIIGPNNTGKSAILESIALLLSSYNDFKDHSEKSILEYFFEEKEYRPEYLIHVNSKFSEITGVIRDEKISLIIEHYPSGFPNDPREAMVIKHFEEHIRHVIDEYIRDTHITSRVLLRKLLDEYIKLLTSITTVDYNIAASLRNKVIERLERKALIKSDEILSLLHEIRDYIIQQLYKSSKLMFTLYDKEKNVAGLYIYLPRSITVSIPRIERYIRYLRYPWRTYISSGLHRVHVEKTIKKIMPAIIFNFRKTAEASFIEELHDIVVSKGKIEKVIELIKEHVTYVKDIRKTEDGMFVFTVLHDKPLPLSSMGEGFVLLLKLSFILSLVDEGVFILEEPEVLLHPGYIDLVAKEITVNSDKSQFFISTHSLDFLKSILEVAEEQKKLSDINVIRLHYRRDVKELLHEVLSGVEAKDEIDTIGTDLRIT